VIELRAATTADLDAVLAFWAESAEDAHRPADTRLAIERLIARDADALTIAVDGGGVVGSLISGWDGWRFHLYRLAVHPRRRREGIARSLLAHAEERLVALGAVRIDAMVLDHNPDAHGFWRAHGYEPQAEWNRWIKAVSAALEDAQ
jgi:ribosomal protein S18 acetylase RimI-like enzyme